MKLGPAKSNVLMSASLVTKPLPECSEYFKETDRKFNQNLPAYRDGFSGGQYCAEDPNNTTSNGRSDACGADSGGPLQMVRNAKMADIVGIVSFGSGCGNVSPGVYTRVVSIHVRKYKEVSVLTKS